MLFNQLRYEAEHSPLYNKLIKEILKKHADQTPALPTKPIQFHDQEKMFVK